MAPYHVAHSKNAQVGCLRQEAVLIPASSEAESVARRSPVADHLWGPDPGRVERAAMRSPRTVFEVTPGLKGTLRPRRWSRIRPGAATLPRLAGSSERPSSGSLAALRQGDMAARPDQRALDERVPGVSAVRDDGRGLVPVKERHGCRSGCGRVFGAEVSRSSSHDLPASRVRLTSRRTLAPALLAHSSLNSATGCESPGPPLSFLVR